MSPATTPLERRAALGDPVARWDRMLEIRRFEDRIKELFAEGLIHGTTHTCQGQEAVSVGLATAVPPSDHVCCTYRGHGHAFALGMTLDSVLGEITGRTIGTIGGVGGSMHLSERSIGLLPTSAIVGAGIPIAAGAALSAQVRGTDECCVALFGDGATNIGAFHEGLNLAAIWKLPVVFVCENNTYGEYTRIDLTTPVTDLAVRASSYAMPSAIVDGQEVDAVIAAMGEALDRARNGGGPTFIECKTYRYSGHSRADAGTYRPPGELDEWLARDPIELYRRQLVAAGSLDDAAADAMVADVEARVEECVTRVMASELATVASMFATCTPRPPERRPDGHAGRAGAPRRHGRRGRDRGVAGRRRRRGAAGRSARPGRDRQGRSRRRVAVRRHGERPLGGRGRRGADGCDTVRDRHRVDGRRDRQRSIANVSTAVLPCIDSGAAAPHHDTQ